MNEKFFPELARRLRQENIETGQPAKSSLPVLVNGQEAMWIETTGTIVLKAGALDDPLVDQVYETAIRASAQVYEYTEAMASAPRLEAAESGLRGCSLDLLVQISSIFGVTLDYLVFGQDKPNWVTVDSRERLKAGLEQLINQLEAFKSRL